MQKKGELYYPGEDFKKKALVNDESTYKEAEEDRVAYWEGLAEKLHWRKKWDEAFVHEPPYFKWFVGGELNITDNIFEKAPQGWENIKDKKAIIWEPEVSEQEEVILTYEELLKKVNKFANALKNMGVKKGDRVGIYLPMIPEVIISMLACARIGAVHTVVFSAFSSQALKIRMQDTKAKVLITSDGYYRRGKVVNLKDKVDEGLKETEVEKSIIVKRAGNEVNWVEGRDIWYHEITENESEECEAETMNAEDLLFILYTSGSTGKPKGILHTCGGYMTQAYWTGKWIFDLKEDDILWCTSDAGWVTGHTYTIYSPLLNKVPTVIFEGAPDWPNPDRWAKTIEKYQVTTFYTAPTAIRMFEKYGKEVIEDYDFESLQLLGSVGEPIDKPAWLWYYENVGKERCPIVDTWWQTETGGVLITSLPGVGPIKPEFAGRPFPGVNAEIRGEDLVILPPFTPGMLRGVYQNPEKYKKTYWSQHGEEVYFTSDAAYKDENGLIRIVGRLDDVIKMAGHRLATGEMEAAINLHEEIKECAVVGVPHEIKGEVPIVFAIYNGERPQEEIKKEIVANIRKEIGPIAMPKEIFLISDLPRTRSGKIMRRILKKLFVGGDLGDLSTLANAESVDTLKELIASYKEKEE